MIEAMQLYHALGTEYVEHGAACRVLEARDEQRSVLIESGKRRGTVGWTRAIDLGPPADSTEPME